MIYVSLNYYLLIIVLLAIYYLIPLKYRWYVLLAGSLGFYFYADSSAFLLFISTLVISYGLSLLIYILKVRDARKDARESHLPKKAVFFFSILILVLPLLVLKNGNFILTELLHKEKISWIVPLGLSFYTLQIISYYVDLYRGKAKLQLNFFKYALYVSFFPQIIQGPIPRYGQLADQLFEGHRFDERKFSKGLQLIIWGFFLKYMIADKAGVIVDTIFGDSATYVGGYVLVGGILYSIQLYTDFMACVTISQGVSGLFGIQLANNFMHPYKAVSIRDFWQRWHISLSTWLRDYIYIPLGGNRKGTLLKYVNLLITFAVSGIWHGAGYKFLFWGLLHACYQIIGEITAPVREKIYNLLKIPQGTALRKGIQTTLTFLLVMLAWIIFRADTLNQGLSMIYSLFTTYNPWIFFNDALFRLGLSWKECVVLLFSVITLGLISHIQEKVCIRDWILEQHIILRWVIYITAVCVIWVMGTYGFGFNAQEFIYGGF